MYCTFTWYKNKLQNQSQRPLLSAIYLWEIILSEIKLRRSSLNPNPARETVVEESGEDWHFRLPKLRISLGVVYLKGNFDVIFLWKVIVFLKTQYICWYQINRWFTFPVDLTMKTRVPVVFQNDPLHYPFNTFPTIWKGNMFLYWLT